MPNLFCPPKDSDIILKTCKTSIFLSNDIANYLITSYISTTYSQNVLTVVWHVEMLHEMSLNSENDGEQQESLFYVVLIEDIFNPLTCNFKFSLVFKMSPVDNTCIMCHF